MWEIVVLKGKAHFRGNSDRRIFPCSTPDTKKGEKTRVPRQDSSPCGTRTKRGMRELTRIQLLCSAHTLLVVTGGHSLGTNFFHIPWYLGVMHEKCFSNSYINRPYQRVPCPRMSNYWSTNEDTAGKPTARGVHMTLSHRESAENWQLNTEPL